MQLRGVVAIDVEGGPLEAPQLRREPVREVPVHDGGDLGVGLRRGGHVDVADAVPDEAQGVAPDPVLAVREHVLPVRVLREGPVLQDLEHLVLPHLPGLLLRRRQDGLRLPLRHEAVGAHDEALAAALADVQVGDLQAQVAGELAAVPSVDGLVHVRELALVHDLGDVQGLVAHGPVDLDEAALVVPAPVRRPTAQLQRLPHGLRLGVLFVTDMALGARGLRVRPVPDLRLRGPARDELVGLVPVASVAPLVRKVHVLGRRPSFSHALLVLPPLLRGHLRRGPRLVEAEDPPRRPRLGLRRRPHRLRLATEEGLCRGTPLRGSWSHLGSVCAGSGNGASEAPAAVARGARRGWKG
mmetsp:Transcript_100273/g.280943  ORF Transcript_100273/g.280943 Transcript_100273/m.280943 type:complete len:355 (+) Transcript_100273:701-1765(+)